MIDNIISGYLRANKRLVVPGLGSFIHKEDGETVFVEFLKKDDGVLTGLLAKEYGLAADEAGEAVAGYADGVRRTVAASGRYVVDGVGVLHSDANGLLELEVAGQPKPEPKPEPVPVFKPEPISVMPSVEEDQKRTASIVEEVVMIVEPEPEPKNVLESAPENQKRTASASEPEVVVFQETVWEPEPEPKNVLESTPENQKRAAPEPVFKPEPISVLPSVEEDQKEKKAFTLNDLYAVPEEEDLASHHNFWQDADPHQQRTASATHHEPAHRAEEDLAEHHNFYQSADHHQKRTVSAPQIRRPARRMKKRIDVVMVVAVVAAVLALSSLFLLTRHGDVAVRKSTQEQPADSTGVPLDIQDVVY
jgi:hypothetical protein